jgi:hypothetical protein
MFAFSVNVLPDNIARFRAKIKPVSVFAFEIARAGGYFIRVKTPRTVQPPNST